MTLRGSQSARRKILVIDDDENIQDLLAVILTRHGYEVETAANGTAGLTALARSLPDMILLDLGLPDMDGLVFLERMAAIGTAKDVPVIVLSARDRNADVVAAVTLGASLYIAKPFDQERLLTSILRLLPQPRAASPSNDTAGPALHRT